MLDAISAEALKFRRHRATWGLVWIWPIGLTIIMLLAIVIDLANGGVGATSEPAHRRRLDRGRDRLLERARPSLRPLSDRRLRRGGVRRRIWLEHLEADRPAPRPQHADRRQICRRFGLARDAASPSPPSCSTRSGWVEDVVTGDPIPAGIALGALLKAHGLAALAAVAPVLLTTAYVSLAAILTRSTVGALVIGLVITTLEQLFRSFAPMLESYAPALVGALYQALPGYHLANIGGLAHGRAGAGSSLPLGRLLDAGGRLARDRYRLDRRPDRPHLPQLPPPGYQLGQQPPDRPEVVAGRGGAGDHLVARQAAAALRERPEIGRARARAADRGARFRRRRPSPPPSPRPARARSRPKPECGDRSSPAASAASAISAPLGWPGSSPSGRLLTISGDAERRDLRHVAGPDLARDEHPIVEAGAQSPLFPAADHLDEGLAVALQLGRADAGDARQRVRAWPASARPSRAACCRGR